MSVHTTLLDFSVDPKVIKNESQLLILATNIENVLRDYLVNLKLMSTFSLDGGCYKVYTGDMGSIITLRIYDSGLITISMEYLKGEDQQYLLTLEKYRQMGQNLRACGITRETFLVPIKRGTFSKYYVTSDDRLIEYDIDNVLFEENSPFQKVQVVHSKSLGNMLVLDDLQNISEADLIYTETLMARGQESYKDKDIVILGGGDGALLYELLKEEPKNVIMLEIDEVVIRACSKHLRSVCGDVLDTRSADNYQVGVCVSSNEIYLVVFLQIIVGDCMKSLDLFHKEGQKFDYIFGDLTDVPITETSETWNFVKKYLELSFKVLKPTGKFMTHGCGACCTSALQRFESYISSLKPSLAINKCQAFIPSFMEFWVFYQINFTKQE
ncbi:hypothetical protein FQA39_LY16969 [Lamprigera yunnana]|nr:hypothetical protein FQA39_LY16969 [Lamprigera yunnana]